MAMCHTKQWYFVLKQNTFYLPNDASPAERLYCVQHNITKRPKCKCCENQVKFYFDSYRKYCSIKCVRNDPDALEAQKQTCIKRYGVENVFQSKITKQKKINSYLKHYGATHWNKVQANKNRVEKTCLLKYGIKNTFQCTKTKNTFLKKYGVENPFKSDIIKEKIRKTFIKKYGFDNPQKNKKIREKVKKTCLLKYGVEHPLQNPEICERNQKYRTKHAIINGINISYQGYELVGWKTLLNSDIKFSEICYKKKEMPVITFMWQNKIKRYFPDFYIPHKNLIIEIKSTWTYKKYLQINVLKKQAAINLGFNFEFWICSDKKILEKI
jgi:hypothetical protein